MFALHDRNPRIDILIHIQRMAQLVGNEFRIVMAIVHERCVRSSHYMEIHPTKPAAFNSGPMCRREMLSLRSPPVLDIGK
jgi:hypothetical protein